MSNEPAVGNWDEDFKEDNKNGGSGSTSNNPDRPKAVYIDMKQPGIYKIRLVGAHVKFRKHFRPYMANVQDGDKDIDPAWKAGFFPPQKWAINVIDRADGKLKILEKGATVFKHFANYKALFGIDPSGKEGPDFAITVTIPKGKDGKPNKLKTEYAVTHLEKAPFTQADMKVICKLDDKGEIKKDEKDKPISNLWRLKEIYRTTSPEKMKKMWDALPEDKKIAPKREGDTTGGAASKEVDPEEDSPPAATEAPAEPVEEKMDGAPADGEDLFDSKESKEKDSSELF